MKKMKLLYTLCISFILLSFGAQAASYTWNGSVSSAWNNPSNWTPNSGVPSVTDDIVIVSSANIPLYNGVSGGCTNLTLTSGTLNLGGFTFTASGNATFTAGTIQNGSFVVSGATTASFGATGPIVFDCPVSITAQTMAVRNATFKNTATLTKTGSSNDNGGGNNTFMGATTINNSGSGYFLFGNTSADNFQGAVTVNNTGSSSVHLAYGSLGNTFGSSLTLNQNSSSGTGCIVSLCRGGNSSATVAGLTTINGASTGGGSIIDLGSGNGCALQFNSAVTISQASTGTGDHDVSIANSSGALLFNGDFTYTSTSSNGNSSRLLITEGNAAGTIVFNGNFTYNNSATVASDAYARILRGTVNFNGNIIVSNTATGAGTTGAYLCWSSAYTGMAILASGKTVSIGAGGFSTGLLRFENFKQMGTTAQNITLTGTAALYSETNTVWNGDVNFKAPVLYLSGATYNGTATLEKNGAGNAHGTGGNTFNGVTSITNSGTSGYLLTGGTNADSFNASTVVNNTSTGAIYVAYAHGGQTTTFASDVTFNITKTASTASIWAISVAEGISTNVVFQGAVNINVDGGNVESDIRFCNGAGSSATYNGKLTINVTNTHANTEIRLGLDNGICVYNEDIEVSNTGSAAGIYFSQGTLSTSTLASGKVITIGSAGFTVGDLRLERFTQLGSTPQSLTLTGTARLILGTGSVWNGNVTFIAPQVLLHGTTYNGTATIEKNGATDNYGNGGNTFNGVTTITNSGSGYLLTGGTNADVFNAATTFNNTGTSTIYIAHNHSGLTTTFASDVTFNSNKSGGSAANSFYIAEYLGNVTFGGLVTFNILGAIESDVRIGNATSSVSTFNGDVVVNNSNSHAGTSVSIGINGAVALNGNIELTNTGGAQGIYFGTGTSSTVTLASGKTISVGAAGYTSGDLSLRRFTQLGSTPQTLITTGTSALQAGYSSTFGGNVTFTAPQIYLQGATYNGTATIEKTGATDNQSLGGNIFNGVTTITNSGSGYFLLANTTRDQFNAVTTFNNNSSNRIWVAYSHNGQTTTFAAPVTFNANRTGSTNSAYVIGDIAGSNVSFADAVTFNIAGTFASSVSVLNNGGTVTFNGDVFVNLTNSNASTNINLVSNGIGIYNGNIQVVNTSGAGSVVFNPNASASSTLASGKTVSIGASGFNSGSLSFYRFTQLGATPQTLTLTGTAALVLGTGSIWNGDVTFKSPQVLLSGTTYNGITNIEKTGAGDNQSAGGNTFNGVTTITNSGTGYFMFGNVSFDQFNAATTFNNTGSNRIYVANNHSGQTTIFASDVTFNSAKTGAGQSASIVITNSTNTHVSFGGTVTVNVSGNIESDIYIANGTGVLASFAGDLQIANTNTHTSTQFFVCNNGTSTYNGNIILSNTGSIAGMYFNNTGTATSTLATGKTITIGGAGYTNGDLALYRFTQLGSTPQAMTLTGTATLYVGPVSNFGGNVTFAAPSVYLNGCIYQGTSLITKTGSGTNTSNGGNTFVGVSNIRNTGSGILRLGNTSPDAFSTDATMDNTGSGSMEIAYNSAGNTFGGTLTYNNISSGATAYATMAASANATVTVAGVCVINNTPSGNGTTFILGNNGATTTFNSSLTVNHASTGIGNNEFYMNASGTGIYNGDVIVTNNSSGTNSRFYIGENNNAATATFNGNFTFNNTSTATSDTYLRILRGSVFFNGNVNLTNTATGAGNNGFWVGWSAYNGNATLADTKVLNIGTFTTGAIRLYRFTQLGSTAQNIPLTGSARLEIGFAGYASTFNGDLVVSTVNGAVLLASSTFAAVTATTTGASSSITLTSNVFGGAVNYTSPSLVFTNNTFNGTTSFAKNGSANNDSNGGNIYNGVASFTLTSTGRWRLGSTAADDYNGNVTFIQNGTGLLQPAYTNASTFGGNISTVGSANAIIFGSNSGTVILDGAADQTWNGDVAKAPSVGKLTISTSNNANLNLSVPVTVTGTLALTSGLINTSATNLLVMANGSAASSGNALSYVNGIMKKIGNAAFTFPVGAGGYWARLGMIPVSGYATTTEFTCQYYASAPANNATASYMNAGITYASGVEYWDLKRVTAAGPTCQVTLYWENSVRSDLNPSAPSDLVVAHFSPSTNKWSSQGGAPASIPSAGSITSTSSLSSFSPITFGSITGQQPLPIQLLSFDAQAQNTGEVWVKWTTASEINNKEFVVERSADGHNFTVIAKVQGAGNSRETRNYSFLDQKALQTGAYYRLKQVDFDGEFTYSSIVKVNGSKATWAMYPNPVAKGQAVSLALSTPDTQEIMLSVTDALGRVVLEKALIVEGRISLNELAILPEGIYVIRAASASETFTQKLVIQ